MPLEFHDAEALAVLVPRLFCGRLLARCLCGMAAGKLLYLGFEDRLDPILALAVERMERSQGGKRVGCRVAVWPGARTQC